MISSSGRQKGRRRISMVICIFCCFLSEIVLTCSGVALIFMLLSCWMVSVKSKRSYLCGVMYNVDSSTVSPHCERHPISISSDLRMRHFCLSKLFRNVIPLIFYRYCLNPISTYLWNCDDSAFFVTDPPLIDPFSLRLCDVLS